MKTKKKSLKKEIKDDIRMETRKMSNKQVKEFLTSHANLHRKTLGNKSKIVKK